ncbi:MAG: HDIG domain-containing protein [Trichlorobacter sp.]|nr:HDIG domain-containing protein [Trichlorobacter sp.]
MQAVEEILNRYCTPKTVAVLMTHGKMVAGKALAACAAVNADAETRRLVIEAAYLHDIGVCRVNAPEIGCFDDQPYIMHGILGREILEQEGLPQHALICERHIGTGLTTADITSQNLPLPQRDMQPETLAERIISYADLYFSKNPQQLETEKTVAEIKTNLARYGQEKTTIFDGWLLEFGG